MTISEASAHLGVSQDTLRYYERIGLIPFVTRLSSGIRNYDDAALRWIEFIKCMRSAGLPIEVLIEYVSLCQQGDETIEIRKEILLEQKRQLIEKIKEMEQTVSRLDYKIEGYEKSLSKREREMVDKLSKT